ncbi:MAG: 30S ribosomal protein S4 [Gemmatimonadetes bacterium]|nr:MAG: 30S ribosomal protein S4 [Gemmatimonadota bacterium]
MARYTGPVCKLCRREGQKLFLKGERCFSDKCAIERRNFIPGQHGQRRRSKISEYGIQLREKQKVRRMYGVLERQFRTYFKKAARKSGVTGHNLLQILERRLDNVVYRLGIAPSRQAGRQLVRHGHFLVNGRKVNIPSYLVNAGDEITVREKSMEVVRNLSRKGRINIPAWLSLDAPKLTGTVLQLPTRDDITVPIQEQLIVELYSK